MKKTIFAASICAPLITTGCMEADPELVAQSNYIRSATHQQVASCRFLGPVSAFGSYLEGGMSAAMSKARQQVVQRGGTHMVIVSATNTYNGYTHGQVEAEAYGC